MESIFETLTRAILDGRRCQPAVFAVEHTASGKRLIVSTQNLSKRLWDQRRYLARRRHHNRALQADLERDGPGAFRFVILDLVRDPSQLRFLRAYHVAESRRHSRTYHSEEHANRKALVIPTLPEPQDQRPPVEPALADALLRLRAAGTFDGVPARIEAWLDRATAGPVGGAG